MSEKKVYPVCVSDFEKIAKDQMDPEFWAFYASVSETGATYQRNLEAFKNLRIIPQFLRKSVAQRSLSTQVLQQKLSLKAPLGISPTGFMSFAHTGGDIAAAKAAENTGSVFIHSGWSAFPLEKITEAAPNGINWQNIYIYSHRDKMWELIKRAEKANFKAIVVTVDLPCLSKAPNRSQESLDRMKLKAEALNITAAHFKGQELRDCRIGDPSATWKDFEEICKFSKLPVIAKGITTARDANAALAHGAAAIIVSNHGGRNLDYMLSTIESLPEVIKTVNGRCDVFLDGGVRSGTDVFKALALGAKAVFVGRPVLWGLTLDGENGARRVLEILREELDLTMALSGCPNVSDITREFVTSQTPLAKL